RERRESPPCDRLVHLERFDHGGQHVGHRLALVETRGRERSGPVQREDAPRALVEQEPALGTEARTDRLDEANAAGKASGRAHGCLPSSCRPRTASAYPGCAARLRRNERSASARSPPLAKVQPSPPHPPGQSGCRVVTSRKYRRACG